MPAMFPYLLCKMSDDFISMKYSENLGLNKAMTINLQ